MNPRHRRVIDALERREPDRVPVMDLMLEYATCNAILGRKPSPLGKWLADPRLSAVLDRVFSRLDTGRAVDLELERFLFLGAEAAEKMGYDAAWLTYFPVLRYRDSRTMVDLFGRRSDVVVDDSGNLTNPVYREGLIKGPEDWKACDKRPLLRLPEKVNRAFSRVRKRFGDSYFIFGFCTYGLFENTWQPLGFERFAVAVRRERGFLKRMIGFLADLYCLLVEAWPTPASRG